MRSDVETLSSALESMRKEVNQALLDLIEDEIAAGAGEVAVEAGRAQCGWKAIAPDSVPAGLPAGWRDRHRGCHAPRLAFELIHTATLVHDDINDEAQQRRGIPTIHAQAGQAKAVIAGDWLFVHGFALGGRYSEQIVTVIARCCANIAVSEYHQLDHVLNLATSPEDYLSIVRGKTAGPFASGCYAAGLVAGLDHEQARALERFGMELGIAFQLVDDLLDLRGDERMGKPRGADVYEGKMTLPLIHALTLSHGEHRTRLSELIETFSDDDFDELMALLERSSSMDYAEILVKTHLERAQEELNRFPASQAKDMMMMITNIVKDRHE